MIPFEHLFVFFGMLFSGLGARGVVPLESNGP
jgi:hypothetical protein